VFPDSAISEDLLTEGKRQTALRSSGDLVFDKVAAVWGQDSRERADQSFHLKTLDRKSIPATEAADDYSPQVAHRLLIRYLLTPLPLVLLRRHSPRRRA